MGEGFVRLATISDATAIQAIYAPYAANTTVSFEVEAPPVEEIQNRIMSTLQNFPYVVYEKEGQILGYAYAGRSFVRPAYQWTAELTVYVSKKNHQGGIGRTLYEKLIRILCLQNVYTVIAVVASPNPPSEAFHEKMGFRREALFTGVGYKLGAWRDVAWMTRRIKDDWGRPEPLRSFVHIDTNEIDKILTK